MSKQYGLGQVLLKDAYLVNAFEKDVQYLKELDEERLLAGFYETAGLKPKKMRYGGWENMLIGGHTLGHYLTAAAQAVANVLCKEEDREILTGKVRRIIDGLLECQAHSQGKPGFVFGATIPDPQNVELQFDYVEQNKTNIITEAWVPWYTMHKILDGVLNVYRLMGYEPALKLGSGIGDWTYDRAGKWTEEIHRIVLGIEYGGMNDALYELYQCTGKKEHLIAAHLFDEEQLFQRVASGDKNVLNNRHANTTIPKFVGALNRYLTLGDEAKDYLEYVEKFWDMVVERHTYATGGNSEWEHFGEDHVLDAERTNCNNETCNTYNMLKMTRKLFMVTGKKKYTEYYENTLINAILSSQNPETGMTMYFQPMATGYFKVYGTPFDKFWCCTGSGMENFTKLNDSIYFKDSDGITVNLFFSSEVTDEELGIRLIQETQIPKTDTVRFTVKLLEQKENSKEGISAKLRIRIPEWACGGRAAVSPKQFTEENGYIVIDGSWQDGETFEVKYVFNVMAKGLPDCDNVFAFSYGPVLLSADLGTENMVDGSTGVNVTIPSNKIVESEYLRVENETVESYIKEIAAHMEREGEELCFTLKGTDRQLSFRPHYRKTRERYGIYWYFLAASGSKDGENDPQAQMEKRLREEKRRESILDVVQPGYGQYENDELHAMEDQGSVGVTDEGTTRKAVPGGSFAYHMKAEPGKDHILELHFLREDNGKLLRIRIGEEEIFNRRLHYTGELEEYVTELSLPSELIGKNLEERTLSDGTKVSTVKITFQGGMFVESARLFGFLYLRRA